MISNPDVQIFLGKQLFLALERKYEITRILPFVFNQDENQVPILGTDLLVTVKKGVPEKKNHMIKEKREKKI